MLAIETVLCPVDFSAATARQLELATDLCVAFGARLVVHHNRTAVPSAAGVGWMWARSHDGIESEAEAERQMQKLLAGLPSTLSAEARITNGSPSHAVTVVAETVAADLVILTTHGSGDDDHTSVTETVLEHADRAVLALHEPDVDAGLPRFGAVDGPVQVVLVPTDLTDESRPAVDCALDLALRLPIELHLMFVEPGAEGRRAQVQQDEQALSQLAPDELRDRVRLHVEHGDPATAIVTAAERLGATCIVMGEHTRAPIRRWFSRDTSRAVLHRSPCPVWYVPGARAH